MKRMECGVFVKSSSEEQCSSSDLQHSQMFVRQETRLRLSCPQSNPENSFNCVRWKGIHAAVDDNENDDVMPLYNRGAEEMQLLGERLRAVLDGHVGGSGKGTDRGRRLFPAGLEAEKS